MTTYGDMTPEQRRNARSAAVAQLNAELNHPAMRAALSADVHTYSDCSHRPDYASAAEHDRDCPGVFQADGCGGHAYSGETVHCDGSCVTDPSRRSLTPIMNGWRPFDDDGGAYGESLSGQ